MGVLMGDLLVAQKNIIAPLYGADVLILLPEEKYGIN